MAKARVLQVIEGGRGAPAPPRAWGVTSGRGSLSWTEGEREWCIESLSARLPPSDADERLPLPLVWDDGERQRLRTRVRAALERARTVRPRLRLANVQRWTPGVDAHVHELARRHARELIDRVRNGNPDENAINIEVGVILEICAWFETLGHLKAAAELRALRPVSRDF